MAGILQRRMLTKADEEAGDEVEVRRQDQDKINKFSRLHQRELVLQEYIEEKAKVKEELEDLSTELELSDEDEKVQYKIGDTFFHIPLEQAQELLGEETSRVDQETHEFEEKLDSVRNEMKQLKVDLYARFGKQINLET